MQVVHAADTLIAKRKDDVSLSQACDIGRAARLDGSGKHAGWVAS